MLLGDRGEAARVTAGGEFSGEAAGGDGQDGAGHVQVGAEVGDGEFEGGDGDAAGSEDRYGDLGDAGFVFPSGYRDAGEPDAGQGLAEPVGVGDGVRGVAFQAAPMTRSRMSAEENASRALPRAVAWAGSLVVWAKVVTGLWSQRFSM
jgi:hypothetical protein